MYTLPSKIEACKKLLKRLNGQTIVFGNDIDTLLELTPNVISSKNNALKNKDILTKFQNKEFPVIGSFKMLEQGANLNNLKNVVLFSYYGKNKSFIQRIGSQICLYFLNSVKPKSFMIW